MPPDVSDRKTFVYIDAGTTTELMIDFLTEKGAVYITNGISHARKLMNAGYRGISAGRRDESGNRGNHR